MVRRRRQEDVACRGGQLPGLAGRARSGLQLHSAEAGTDLVVFAKQQGRATARLCQAPPVRSELVSIDPGLEREALQPWVRPFVTATFLVGYLLHAQRMRECLMDTISQKHEAVVRRFRGGEGV